VKRLEFTPQQMRSWSRRIDVDDIYACMAIHANEIFNEWYRENIENAPTVYGTEHFGYYGKTPEISGKDTHRAKLVCVEEIK
jgi:hypothetical protein